MDSINVREAEITKIVKSQEAREALERHLKEVIEGPAFKGSHRSVLFLKHVVEQAVAGSFDSLKERAIGIDLFGRSPSYVTGEDAIVRVTANDVRRRLVQHYDRHGTASELRINLPLGTYIPEIIYWDQSKPDSLYASNAHRGLQDKHAEPAANQNSGLDPVVAPEPVSVAPAPTGLETARSTGSSGRRWLSLASVLGVLNFALFGILLYGLAWMRSPRTQIQSVSVAPVSVLPWSAIFGSPNPTHLIASDPDIDEIQILTASSISLSDYANHIYIPPQETLTAQVREICLKLLQGHRAALIDTQVAAEVAALAQSNSRKIEVQGARSLQFSNLKTDDNFIFLGSPRSDPWVSVFSDQLDFRFVIDNTGFESIRNVHPHPHEQTEYVPNGGGGATGQSFAIIALVRNPDQNGQILLLAGANAEGTQSAGKLVTDLSRLSMELRKCGIPPSGPLEHFELLLHVKMMASSASEYNVLACHILTEPSAH